jgi:enamine deaminase RidA (YjgF/YER057c/UK114 family)
MRSATYRLLTFALLASYHVSAVESQDAAKKSPAKASTKSAVHLFNPTTMAKPVSTYSHVAEITGIPTGTKLVFIAGQVGNDASGKLAPDFRTQVEQAFKNIKAAVEAAGGSMSDLVKISYYCAESVDPSEFPALREVRDTYIDAAHPPTSTFVVVKRLVRPDYLIEIEAVAAMSK